MTRLLRADFSRLWKSKSFIICLIIAALDAPAAIFSAYLNDKECVERLGSMILSRGTDVMFIASIFTALYLGTDYSNGTLRNKLMIGHTRMGVYSANLITVMAGSFMCAAANWLAMLAAGLIMGGSFGMSTEEFLKCTAVYVCAFAALCAVNTLIGMLLAVKSSTVVVILTLMLGTMMISASLTALLGRKTGGGTVNVVLGGSEDMFADENSDFYVKGTRRMVYNLINNIMPCGPMYRISGGTMPEDGGMLPVYSLGVTAVSTALGSVVFRRKDLK